MAELEVKEGFLIGVNNQGYSFSVGLLGDRWVGFAQHKDDRMIHFFPEISEEFEMGLPDKETAIRLTAALAQTPEKGYGGVDRWFIKEDLRGNPADYRCGECQEVGCRGNCVEEF